jgi:hypothetical protein
VLGLLSALGFTTSALSTAKIALGNAIAIENKNITRTEILRMILSPE